MAMEEEEGATTKEDINRHPTSIITSVINNDNHCSKKDFEHNHQINFF